MTHTEKCNPVAERAAKRRQQWEQGQPGFWTRKRFDMVDLLILLSLMPSVFLVILAVIH